MKKAKSHSDEDNLVDELTLHELCRFCDADEAWVVELIQHGVVEPHGAGEASARSAFCGPRKPAGWSVTLASTCPELLWRWTCWKNVTTCAACWGGFEWHHSLALFAQFVA